MKRLSVRKALEQAFKVREHPNKGLIVLVLIIILMKMGAISHVVTIIIAVVISPDKREDTVTDIIIM